MATSANDLERVADLRDVYYAPGVHARLVSLGELEGQGPVRQRREGKQRLPGGAQRDNSEDHISCMHDGR